jgi:hypothetical protein
MRQEGEFHASAESLRSACARAHAGVVAALHQCRISDQASKAVIIRTSVAGAVSVSDVSLKRFPQAARRGS